VEVVRLYCDRSQLSIRYRDTSRICARIVLRVDGEPLFGGGGADEFNNDLNRPGKTGGFIP